MRLDLLFVVPGYGFSSIDCRFVAIREIYLLNSQICISENIFYNQA